MAPIHLKQFFVLIPNPKNLVQGIECKQLNRYCWYFVSVQLLISEMLVDTTYISDYILFLTTLVTVDSYCSGCGAGFCLHNGTHKLTMTELFTEVKSAADIVIQTNTFMSDDTSLYYDARCAIIGQPKHAFCTLVMFRDAGRRI